MDIPSGEEIAGEVYSRFINQKVILNVFRAFHVEAMVARALTPDYQLSRGWEAYDLIHLGSGCRIEVKQSATRQTWHEGEPPKWASSFDIACRTGEFDGSAWLPFETPKRAAHIYIFAWHGIHDDTCDQRDPAQWIFYVVPASKLKIGQKTAAHK